MVTVWWDTTVGNNVFKEIYQKLKNQNFFPVLSGVRAAGACLVRMYLGEIGDLAKHYRYQLCNSASTRKKLEVATLLTAPL